MMDKQNFVEMVGETVHVEPADELDLEALAVTAREKGAWKFRRFERRWETRSAVSGWSRPTNHGPWYYVDVEIIDEDELDEHLLQEKLSREENGVPTLAIRLPDGSTDFVEPKSTLIGEWT